MLTSIAPPHFDCDLFNDGSIRQVIRKSKTQRIKSFDRSPSPQSDDLDFEAENDADDNFLVIGLTKGNIIFVRMDLP